MGVGGDQRGVIFRSDMTAELVKSSASDLDAVRSARVSTVGEAASDEVSDVRARGMINFLLRDRHGSPFEHNSMTFLVCAPLFVAREFMRHRAGWSYNEESGRYRELQPVFYVPDERRALVQVGKPGAYRFEEGTERQRLLTEESMKQIQQRRDIPERDLPSAHPHRLTAPARRQVVMPAHRMILKPPREQTDLTSEIVQLLTGIREHVAPVRVPQTLTPGHRREVLDLIHVDRHRWLLSFATVAHARSTSLTSAFTASRSILRSSGNSTPRSIRPSST